MSIPKTTKAWTVEGKNGFDSLKYHEEKPLPPLGDKEVMVKSAYTRCKAWLAAGYLGADGYGNVQYRA